MAEKQWHPHSPALPVREIYLEYSTLASIEVPVHSRHLVTGLNVRDSSGNSFLVKVLLLHDFDTALLQVTFDAGGVDVKLRRFVWGP